MFFVSIDDKERQMYYKLSETINKNRFDNGDIQRIHDVFVSYCDTINDYLYQKHFEQGQKIQILQSQSTKESTFDLKISKRSL